MPVSGPTRESREIARTVMVSLISLGMVGKIPDIIAGYVERDIFSADETV